MPLAIPWLLGAFGVGGVAGFAAASPFEKALKYAAIAGVVYIIYKKVK